MSIIDKIKQYVSLSDMFYSTQMLRFKSDTQYKTFTGGLITIAVIIMVTVGFFNMISETINRTAITANLIQTKSNDPTYYNLKADPKNNFMFGVQIQPADLSFIIDLANSTRYFDVSLGIFHMQYGIVTNQSFLPLVPCTDEHWMQLPQIVAKADLYGYSKWLCPQIGTQFPLQGSYISADNFITQILVYPCSNDTNPESPCAPQEQIDEMFNTYENFYFTVNYINTVVNPTQPNHLSYYLQGSDCIIFSKTQGSELWFYFSDFQILTDYSIWPFQQISIQKGSLLSGRAINHPFTVSKYNGYVNAYFSKASNSFHYERTVQKISAVFSYIGGLVGAISAALFFLKIYTEMSLEISIAIGIFSTSDESQSKKQQIEKMEKKQINKAKEQKQNNYSFQSFNFFTFVSLLFYTFLKRFKFTKKWKETSVLYNLKEQVLNQLDIKALLRRLISIQNCLSCILDQDQILGFKYHQKINYVRAQELRNLFLLQQPQSRSQIQQDIQNEKKTVKFGFLSNNCIANQFCYNEHINNEKNKRQNIQIIQGNEFSANNFIKSISSKRKVEFMQSERISQDSYSSSQNDLSIINAKTFTHLNSLKQKSQQNQISRRIWQNVNTKIKSNIILSNSKIIASKNNESCQTNKQNTSFIKVLSDFSI